MSSYNLRPRKQTNYRVLNGFNIKAVIETSKPEQPPPPAEEIHKPVEVLLVNEMDNMDSETQKIYRSEKKNVRNLCDLINAETNKTNKVILHMMLLEKMYDFIVKFKNFIVQFGNYNPAVIAKCKRITQNYIGLYNCIKHDIVDYCLEHKKMDELLTFENNYKELKNLP
jgi:predicted type IV restriction endonuclease